LSISCSGYAVPKPYWETREVALSQAFSGLIADGYEDTFLVIDDEQDAVLSSEPAS
jgi:hypothetical protein